MNDQHKTFIRIQLCSLILKNKFNKNHFKQILETMLHAFGSNRGY